MSAANARERRPGSWTAQTRHRPGTNKGDDGYSDDATYDQRQRPQRYHDLSLPAAPDFRSLSEFIKKPLQIQIPGFLMKNGETSEVFSSGKTIEWITPTLGLAAGSATSIIARCIMMLMTALSELRISLRSCDIVSPEIP